MLDQVPRKAYPKSTSSDIDEILRNCNFSESFIRTANDLQILEAISGCYEEYKILSRR